MKWLDLFSGIGGVALGLSWAGFPPPVAFVEIDTYCQRVLRRHWSDVPIHGDIRELEADAVGPVDLICGGPPCQPASRAGRQRGTADDRWLWGEALRLVEALRPGWVVFENPPGIYDVGLAGILSTLEGWGYANAVGERGEPIIYPIEIPACASGAPQIRQRVWIIASGMASAVGPGPQKRAGERGHDGAERQAVERDGGVGNAWEDSRWLFCDFDQRWRRLPQPGVRRMADRLPAGVGRDMSLTAAGVPNRVARLHALGNSVVPQVVAEIGLAIQGTWGKPRLVMECN